MGIVLVKLGMDNGDSDDRDSSKNRAQIEYDMRLMHGGWRFENADQS